MRGVTSPTISQTSPLHYAAIRAHLASVELLVEKDFTMLNYVNKDGNNALHLSVDNKSLDEDWVRRSGVLPDLGDYQ